MASLGGTRWWCGCPTAQCLALLPSHRVLCVGCLAPHRRWLDGPDPFFLVVKGTGQATWFRGLGCCFFKVTVRFAFTHFYLHSCIRLLVFKNNLVKAYFRIDWLEMKLDKKERDCERNVFHCKGRNYFIKFEAVYHVTIIMCWQY